MLVYVTAGQHTPLYKHFRQISKIQSANIIDEVSAISEDEGLSILFILPRTLSILFVAFIAHCSCTYD